MRLIANFLALTALLTATACGEHAFSAHSRDNNAEDMRRALAIAKAPAPGPQNGTGHAMAFLVTVPPEKQLVGVDLQTNTVAWKVPADVRSRIAVARGIVAHRQGENEIVARDPKSGQVTFTLHIPASERFMGLAVDDERLYYVVQATAEGLRVSHTVAVDRGGHELWRTPAPGTLAAPAARGGLVAVPFAYQNVSLLDGATGKEVGRVRATDEQISFVRALPEGIFYGGGRGVYLLDEKSMNGTRAGSSYAEAKLGSEQMRPFYNWDGYQPAQSDYSAFDRNRLLWRGAVHGGKFGFEENTAVVHSFRYLFAFNTKTGKLRWAYAHPRIDLVGSEDVGASVVFAAADGDLGALDEASGQSRILVKTGLRLAGATIDADGLRIEAGNADDAQDTLRAALEQIIWDPDARFTAVKVFATGALGDIPGLPVSAALLKIVRAHMGVPKQAQKRAGEALIARKDKSALPLLLEGLAMHTDFLADRHAVGVDVMARAAGEMGGKEAAPLIGSHLADPETPQSSLRDLVAALGALGGKDSIRALRSFLLTYRADPMFLQDPSALNAAGLALLAASPDERRTVAFVAEERRTLPPVAEALKVALADGSGKQKRAAKAIAKPAPQPAEPNP